MNQHLSDTELSELLEGEAGPRASAHLAGCALCRTEQAKLARAIAALRASLAWFPQPAESFWTAQRADILAAVPSCSPPAPRLAWAAILAVGALALVLLTRPAPPPPSAQTAATPPESDHELMVQVEASLERGLPHALEPAGLLVEEMGRAQRSTPHVRQPRKETTYAD